MNSGKLAERHFPDKENQGVTGRNRLTESLQKKIAALE
jgi:hypothetical protein